MDKPRYYLTVNAAAVGFRVGINQVPLRSELQGVGHSSDAPVNAWLHPEGNELTIDLFWPPLETFQAGKAKFTAQIYLSNPESNTPKPLRMVAEFRWPQPNVPEAYPFRTRIPLKIEDRIPTILWGEAEKIEDLTDTDRAALVTQVENLRQALVSRNVDAAYTMLRYKSLELAKADYQDDLADIEKIDHAQLNWMLKEDPLQAALFSETIAAFEIVARKQVVHVFRKDGESAITLKAGTRSFGMTLYFSRIKGQWKIVR